MHLKQQTETPPQQSGKFVNTISESVRNWIFVELNNKRKNLAMLESLGMERKNLAKTDINLVQADGSTTDVLGTMTVKISIKGISMDINVTVVRKLHNGFLLGARELNKMEAQINCHKSVVSFFGGTVSTPLLSATSLINTVSATKNVTLRPQKGIKLKVQARNKAITDGKHYIVEPFTDNRHGVMVPQLITKSTGHSLYIPVCNFTDSTVSIRKGRPIATVYEMQQHGLSVLEPTKPSNTAHAEPVTATKPQCEYKINKDLPHERG
jgi:hypothetical protein